MSDGSGEKIKKFVFKTKTPNVGEGPPETLEVVIPEVKTHVISAACRPTMALFYVNPGDLPQFSH